jgi:hypothetical protein
VDVLIREDDFPRAHDALVESGRFSPWKKRAPLHTSWVRRHVSHFNYTHENGSCLEVHVRLLGRSTSLDAEMFLESGRMEKSPAGPFLPVPRPELTAAHLVFHALDQHSFHPLLQLKTAVDLNDIVSSCGDSFDGDLFLEGTGLDGDVVLSYVDFLKRVTRFPFLDTLPSGGGPGGGVFEDVFEASLDPGWKVPGLEPPAAVEMFAREAGLAGKFRAVMEVFFPHPAKLAYVHDIPLSSPRLVLEYLRRPVYLLSRLDVSGVMAALNAGACKRSWRKR